HRGAVKAAPSEAAVKAPASQPHGPLAQPGETSFVQVPPNAAEALIGMDVGYLEIVLGAKPAIRARGYNLVELKLRLAPRIVSRFLLGHDADRPSPDILRPARIGILALQSLRDDLVIQHPLVLYQELSAALVGVV